MKFEFVGAGSAFNKEDGQSNIIITSNSRKKLLIDCGSYCWPFMKESFNCDIFDIDGVYISHLHSDHVGGLEELAFRTFFDPSLKKPSLYVDFRLMDDLWDYALCGGLGVTQEKNMSLSDYFKMSKIPHNGEFVWEDIRFQTIQTQHVINQDTVKFSYGLLIKEEDTPIVFLTTDTQFCPDLIGDFYKQADLILHDCETSKFKSGVHAHYDDLKTLNSNIKSKMLLYHYQPRSLQKKDNLWKEDGFKGFIDKGQTFYMTWDYVNEN